MNHFTYPLANSTWDQDEFDAMQRVIESSQFTMGERVKAYERGFADYQESRYAVMVNSGSSANLLMVAALFFKSTRPLKPGDEVIVPAVSWSTSYTPLHQYGLKLKFVDVDLETLNFDLDALESAVSENTRLIMAVNLLGNPNEFNRITEIIGGREIVLIEDNCESLGAKFDGKKAGSFGVMGSFSSFFSHHISTMEGGIITTDDEELYHILLSLRAHGWTRNLPKHNKITPPKSDDPFEESFRFVLPGYNVRPLELSGAIGVEQLKKLPNLIAGRRKNATIFQQIMTVHDDIIIQKECGDSSWFGFSMVLRPGAVRTRDELRRSLAGKGFECRPIVAGNFTLNPVMKYFNAEVHGNLTNASHIHHNGLFIGNHHYDVSKALDVLKTL